MAWISVLWRMNIVKTVIKYLIDQSAKQYRCYITVRQLYTHHVDAPVQTSFLDLNVKVIGSNI